MGRGVGELQNAPELTCNVSCTLLCIHATAAFPLSSPLNLMLAIGDLSSALLLLLLPSSAISATCLRDCQLLLDCCIVVAVSSSPPPSLTVLPTPVILSLPCRPSLSLSRSLSCYYCRWSQIAFSSVGWKAWPDSCRWWISVLVHCGRQQIDIITAAKPLERWRRGRKVHTTKVGADRSTHGRQKKAKKLWEKKERSSKEKAYEEHLLQQAPCKQRHAKIGNAEDGFPVESSLSLDALER